MATLWEYIVSKLRSEEKPDVEEDKKQLEKVAEALPDAVMPNKALQQRKKRFAEIDEITKEK